MTPEQLSLLCAAAYFNPPECTKRALYAGLLTLGALCRAILCTEGADGCAKTLLKRLILDPALDLPILRYENKNRSTGFVAYAFQVEGGTICAFRGSESSVCGHISLTDWEDNFLAPFVGSVQYPDIEEFIGRYQRGRLILTGHSKGAHNALWALARTSNPNAICICFDGQGFSRGTLTREEKRQLSSRATNNVSVGDIVGALLMHPERRVFVKKQGNLNAHELCSLTFDAQGAPVPGTRPLKSYIIELTSTVYVNAHLHIMGRRAPKWLQKLVDTQVPQSSLRYE